MFINMSLAPRNCRSQKFSSRSLKDAACATDGSRDGDRRPRLRFNQNIGDAVRVRRPLISVHDSSRQFHIENGEQEILGMGNRLRGLAVEAGVLQSICEAPLYQLITAKESDASTARLIHLHTRL